MTVSGSRKHLEVNNKVDRPDGTDVGRYRNLNKWSYRKWAWEFLRRNTSFIAECKRVRNGTEADRQAVADQYGLKKFKMYAYSTETGHSVHGKLDSRSVATRGLFFTPDLRV